MDSSAYSNRIDDVPISTIDTSNEIKEEPVEIKEEPIDEFADIKQEDPLEDPIADVVPMSPIDTSHEIKEEPVETKEEPFDEFPDLKKEDPLEEPIADIFCPSTGISPSMGVDCSDATKHQNLDGESSKSKRSRKCVVCHHSRNEREMRRFTTQNKRITWVNAVRSTPEGRKSLMELLSATKNPFLCSAHFSPSDYFQKSNCAVLKFNAVPFFTDSTANVSGEEVVLHSSYDSMALGKLNEIKDEPIKNERVDEIADIKQEEPISDIFCPSTGSSRPIDQMPPIGIEDKNSTKKIENQNLNGSSSTPKVKLRKCVVCQYRLDAKDMHTFTTDPLRRAQWVNAVRSTEEGRTSFMELLSATKTSFLCASHFAPSAYDHYPNSTVLRRDAVPFFEDSIAKYNGVDGSSTGTSRQIIFNPALDSNDAMAKSMSQSMINVLSNPKTKSRKCDMCASWTRFYVTSPIDSFLSREFFDNLIYITPSQRERIDWFLRNGQVAYVCSKHIETNRSQEPRNDSPSKSNGVAGLPLFTLDSPYEIKEEPVEIKEDPIDEFADIKQEEPIADIFFTSTGISRPIGPAEKRCKYGLREEKTSIDNESRIKEEPIKEEPIDESGPSKSC